MTQSRRKFRPTLGPTLMVIPAVLFMAGLGVWQVERRAWKTDLIETRRSRIASPAIALPQAPDLSKTEYRRVRLRGRFLHDREMYLGGRSWRGKLGYHIITPMTLSVGGAVLVNRGWVPVKRKDRATRQAGQISGEISIIGHLRAQPAKSRFSPDNDPDKNFWFQIDLSAMAAHAKLRDTPTFYVQAAEPIPPGGWPKPVPIGVNLPNDHLKYAITWFALAVAFAAIYVLYHLRRRSK
ncbi:MAG: SURF1 family protein [Alphaproteobacteria bacterium]|nr:SURF1 family protein [Alphaproteobacteria bacterium]